MKDYKKILEGVVNIINTAEKSDIGFANICTYIGENCPELKESEDESMVKFIKNQLFNIKKTITENYELDAKLTKAICWIEKQCEQKIKTPEESLGIDSDTYNKIVDECIYGEQKPIDKVEPKFEVGDLITNGILVGRVDAINKRGYHAYFGDFYSDIPDVNNWHKWTIQDAKDGDILCSNQIIVLFKQWEDDIDYNFVIAHAGIDISGKLQITNGHWLINNKSKPATKEQRDLLFHKMHEAGYEWDANKKELIKIEQKPAWSEEDEEIHRKCICAMRASACGFPEEEKFVEQVDNWLKSIKYRVQVQPQNKWISVNEEVYVKEPVLAQKKDKSDPFGGFVVCCDHTLTPNVYERYMILGNIVSQNT